MLKQNQSNLVQASILGFILGDALGVPVEFESREFLNEYPVIGMSGFGTYNQAPGTWSDDTSMMLCVMIWLTKHSVNTKEESLTGKELLCDLADRFVNWYQHGYLTPHGHVFDIGNATRTALDHYIEYGNVYTCGISEERKACGNGSLMRSLPFAFRHLEMGLAYRLQLLRATSEITHNHLIPSLCSMFYVTMLSALFEGKDKGEAYRSATNSVLHLIRNINASTEDISFDALHRILTNEVIALSVEEIVSSGYVIHTLEAVLWCFMNSDSYTEAVLKAVNLGNDTDTIAALTGGLAGCYYGKEGLPEEWIDTLVGKDELLKLINDFIG